MRSWVSQVSPYRSPHMRGSMSPWALGYRSRSLSLPCPWSSPHHRPSCIPRLSSWEPGTTGMLDTVLGTGDIITITADIMGTIVGTGDTTTVTPTAGTVGNDEEDVSAWLCREDVCQGTPGRRALTQAEGPIADIPFSQKRSLNHTLRHHVSSTRYHQRPSPGFPLLLGKTLSLAIVTIGTCRV